MNQVLMNILSNAIDALEEDDAQRSLKDKADNVHRITVSTTIEQSDWLKISISDNGIGMSESVKSKIFDPFFTTKAIGKGTGMGMPISYKIVTEKHGGKLDCFSTPGEGTEFVIQIPIQQADHHVTA